MWGGGGWGGGGGGWGGPGGWHGKRTQWSRNRYARYGRTGVSGRGLLTILDDEEMGHIYDHKVVKRLLPYLKPHLGTP